MNLHSKLKELNCSGRPIRIGMIGDGNFATMFLAQARKVPGIHIVGIVELNPETARSNLSLVGWTVEQFSAANLDEAITRGTTHISEDLSLIHI